MIDPLKAMKIRVIADAYVKAGTDKRSFDEVHQHMLEWFSKGWLNDKFVDECHKALTMGRKVHFNYEPGKYYIYGAEVPQSSAGG